MKSNFTHEIKVNNEGFQVILRNRASWWVKWFRTEKECDEWIKEMKNRLITIYGYK